MDICVYSSKNVEEALSSLEAIQQTVIRERYGLDGEEAKSLDDIANMIDMSSERIRQIEAKALRMLRHPTRARVIKPVEFNNLKNSPYITEEEKNKLINIENELWETDTIVSYTEQSNIPKLDCSKLSILAELITELEAREQESIEVENITIEEMNLSIRTFNALKRAGKDSIQDIVGMTEEDFKKVKNLGPKSKQEVIARIEEYGYVFDENIGFRKHETKENTKESLMEDVLENTTDVEVVGQKEEPQEEKRSETDILEEMKARREQLEQQLAALEEQTRQARALLAEYDKIIGDGKTHTEDETPDFKDE